jgi:phage protein D
MPNSMVNKNRQSTIYFVKFPTLPSLQLQPIKVDLHEERYHHDIAIMQFATTIPKWFDSLKTGIPVTFSYEQGGFNRTWSGYVSFVSKHVIGQTQEIMEVHCLGATFALKDRATRVFTNTTITNAVETIVKEHGFKFDGEPYPAKFEQLTLAGHSYWEWIQEQAKKIGYGVLIDGMTFVFKPYDSLINYGVTSIPIFAMTGKGTGITNQALDRTLDWFKVLNGEHVEHPHALRATKQLGGVNPLTGSVHVSKTSPKSVGKSIRANTSDVLFSELRQDQVVNSSTISKSLSEGAAHGARMNLPAKLQGQGDPRIRLFNPVMVLNTGELTDGLWVVNKAVHHFSANNNYQVDLDISTDGVGGTSSTYASKAPNTYAGMVDLIAALNNGGTNPSASNSKAVSLQTLNPTQTELGQGWQRTPSKWIHSGTV